MIRVGNVKKEPGVYIGRFVRRYNLRASPLHNPFRIGRNRDGRTLNRTEAIAEFERIFRAEIRVGCLGEEAQRLLDDLVRRERAGEEIVLVCWCAPLVCHGDVVAAVVRELARRST